MNRKPRSTKTGIFTKGMIWRIFYQGGVIGGAAMTAFIIGLRSGASMTTSQTMAFATLIIAQLLYVRTPHSNKISFYKITIRHKMHLLAAIAQSALLLLLVLFVPTLRDSFKLAQLTTIQWLIVGAMSILPQLLLNL